MGRCVDVYLNKKQTCERHANKERRKNDCRNKERLLDASPRAIYLAVSAKRGAKPSAFLLQQNCDNKQYRNDDLKPEEKIPHYSPILAWAHTKVKCKIRQRVDNSVSSLFLFVCGIVLVYYGALAH